jgi:preprotein translocase subunit SecG
MSIMSKRMTMIVIFLMMMMIIIITIILCSNSNADDSDDHLYSCVVIGMMKMSMAEKFLTYRKPTSDAPSRR